MTSPDADAGARLLAERARFLTRHELFRRLAPDELGHVAESVEERVVSAGEAVLIQDGPPGTQLYVVREGFLELVRGATEVALVATGEVFGHSSLLTGEPPAFTVRARHDARLYCIPGSVGVDLLTRPEGVRFVAHSDQDRLIQAAQAMSLIPDVRLRDVTTLVRRAPVFCEPDLPIRDAALRMAAEGVTALLVRLRDGLGIVTDRDMRVKAVAAGLSGDEPVSGIMSAPVRTVRAGTLAPEASIEMMESDIKHLPVVDADGRVIGILSAESLMALDALSPFALRSSIHAAHSEDDLVAACADIPDLFVDLVDAHVDAFALSRVLTVLSDALTSRLLDLVVERRGRAPVAFAWLALGSMGRSELTLASDQDNGIAFEDDDDPGVEEYFRSMAEDVNRGLARCGFELDPHGVVASNPHYRMPQARWMSSFAHYLGGWDNDRLIGAAIAFDFRQVAGDLAITPALTEIVRQAPGHRLFLRGLAELGSEVASPLQGFRQRLLGPIDIKKSGLLPIQNLARYYAFAHGVSAATTSDRLAGVVRAAGPAGEAAQGLRDAFASMMDLRSRHHADLIRAGRRPDNAIDTTVLLPLTKATLQEAFRVLAAAQKRLPQQPAPR